MGFVEDDERGIFVILVLGVVFGGIFGLFLGLYVIGVIIAVLIVVITFVFQSFRYLRRKRARKANTRQLKSP